MTKTANGPETATCSCMQKPIVQRINRGIIDTISNFCFGLSHLALDRNPLIQIYVDSMIGVYVLALARRATFFFFGPSALLKAGSLELKGRNDIYTSFAK